MNGRRKLFQKQDIVLIAVILASALLAFAVYSMIYRRSGTAFAVISYDGAVVKTAGLSEDCVFALEQNPNVIFEIKGNAIAFTESDCPDKICVHSGFLKYPGQSAACLPNRIALRIVADNGGDSADAVAN